MPTVMVTRVSRVVTQRAILPGTRSGAMKRDSQDIKTNMLEGINVCII